MILTEDPAVTIQRVGAEDVCLLQVAESVQVAG